MRLLLMKKCLRLMHNETLVMRDAKLAIRIMVSRNAEDEQML